MFWNSGLDHLQWGRGEEDSEKGGPQGILEPGHAQAEVMMLSPAQVGKVRKMGVTWTH